MRILHIKNCYFEIPETVKDDIGCILTILGTKVQTNKNNFENAKCKIDYEIIEK